MFAGFEISYTDESGTVRSKSFWRPVSIQLFTERRILNVKFEMYNDLGAYQGGKPPVVGQQRDFTIAGDDFDTYILNNPSLVALYVAIATLTKDILSGHGDRIFENAVSVDIALE